jgi:uncharacterized cupredoxin-like copper-binding protein
MSRVRWIAMVVVAAALVGAGCGSDSSDDSSGSSGSGGSTSSSSSSSDSSGGGAGAVKISETEFKLTPATAKVAKAGKVTFNVVNDGQTTHALEVEGPGEEAKTDALEPGKSAKLTVDLSKAGTYEMYCPIANHKAMGMVGKVVVAGGGSGKVESDDDSGGGKGGSGY